MKIKPLELKDLKWFVEQTQRNFTDGAMTTESLINYLAKPGIKAYKVCDKDGTPFAARIGLIKENPENKDKLAISGVTLLTQKEYQGKGYAKKLLKYFFKIAKKNNINTLRSRVETTNTPCIKIHEQLGYEKRELYANGYGPGRDCQIWVKKLK